VSDVVLVDYTDHVMTITINRPQVRNAVDHATAAAMAAALEELDARPDLLVGILTGAGGTFSAGMDLKAFARGGPAPTIPPRGFAGLAQLPPRTPLIAAVEGFAFGGGCEIALACDLIVAAENAAFALPEVKRGLVAGGGAALRLPHRIPYHLAMEIILTGAAVPATRAHELGLVNRLTPPGGALGEARELATAISANGPLAVMAAKRIAVESADWPLAEKFDRQEAITAPVRASADAKEGVRAFTEKRAPIWRGE
jgi:enoyl-CoA hydratase